MIGTIARILVALVLTAAALLKLREGPLWLRQAADMDVSRPVAQAVPLVELVIAVPLLLGILSPWPAVAAIALFVVFTVAVLRRILDGSRPPCACFGSRSKRPLGPYHVARNVGLVALATVAVIAS